MATITTIRERCNWADLPEPLLKANEGALSYICSLAAQANANISRWQIDTTFGDGDGNLLTDPRVLNKAFFAKLMETKARPIAAEEAAPPEVVKVLRDYAKRLAKDARRAAADRVTHAQNQAQSFYSRYLRELRTATQAQRAFEQADFDTTDAGRSERVAEGIGKALGCGFYLDPVVGGDNNDIWMRTQPVVLTERNVAAGLNLRVEMGSYAIKLTIGTTPQIQVFPYDDNLLVCSNYHPHVNGSGNICWGNAKEMAIRHLSKWEFGEALILLRSLLTQYSDTAPYQSLADFAGNDDSDEQVAPYDLMTLNHSNWHPGRDRVAICNALREQREAEARAAAEADDADDDTDQLRRRIAQHHPGGFGGMAEQIAREEDERILGDLIAAANSTTTAGSTLTINPTTVTTNSSDDDEDPLAALI